ncbi:hypothetical protein ACFS07_17130 [Undibacterium arcticum]
MSALALRNLDTARTGAYYFCGSVRRICSFIDIAGDTPGTGFWLAEALMGAGIWLHVTEKHTHQDTHVPMTHANKQTHDEHYQHKHDFSMGIAKSDMGTRTRWDATPTRRSGGVGRISLPKKSVFGRHFRAGGVGHPHNRSGMLLLVQLLAPVAN